MKLSPNQCMMPTSSRVSGRGMNMRRTGIMMVDIPKPVMVPTTLARMVSGAMQTISASIIHIMDR
jgi:hypothetical protein